MNYYVTLVGKDKYAFGGNFFFKDHEKQVKLDVYQEVVNHPMFTTRIEPVTSTVISTDTFETVVSKDRMNIALAYSPNWSTYVRVQVYALFKNNPPPIKVYLMSDELGKLDLDQLCSYFGAGYEYEFIDIGSIYNKYIPSTINVSSRFTKYTLYRLLMPILIPVDRLLYIDTDAIVCGNIKNFYHMDLGNNILAGVQDIGTAMPAVLKAINFPPNAKYINAGVTLIDMKKVRDLKLYPTWLEMVNKTRFNCHDQDIFNITCKDRIAIVDNRYNASLSTGYTVKDIRIMHYAGTKPWKSNTVPHFAIWDKYQKEYDNLQLQVIPKFIHYCWFGGKEKPKVVQDCLLSWEQHMPKYKIVEWNESNFNLNAHGNYVKEAAATKKWAFVTDYIRLWALKHFGGIYMDSDVLVLKPLDRFLQHRAFTGHETHDLLITATMGAEPEHPWIEHLLSYYEKAKLDCVPNTKTVSAMSKPFITNQKNGFTYLKNGVVIYPIETFCSYDHRNLQIIPNNNAYTHHLFAGTWIGRTII